MRQKERKDVDVKKDREKREEGRRGGHEKCARSTGRKVRGGGKSVGEGEKVERGSGSSIEKKRK